MSDETRPSRRPPSPRDLALASVPPHLREPLLAAGGDAGADKNDPLWVVIAHAFRSRAAAEAAEASAAEIAASLERLPALLGTAASAALGHAAREAAQQVGESIAKPAVVALDRAARLGARRARLETAAAALLAASVIWALAILFSPPLATLPLPTRLAAILDAPAWPLLVIQALALSAAFLLTRERK
ncbi:MAG: hypothetical protein ACYCZB_14160 [Acidiphilium sp.]